jgi:hypothetical protein
MAPSFVPDSAQTDANPFVPFLSSQKIIPAAHTTREQHLAAHACRAAVIGAAMRRTVLDKGFRPAAVVGLGEYAAFAAPIAANVCVRRRITAVLGPLSPSLTVGWRPGPQNSGFAAQLASIVGCPPEALVYDPMHASELCPLRGAAMSSGVLAVSPGNAAALAASPRLAWTLRRAVEISGSPQDGRNTCTQLADIVFSSMET